MSSLKKNITYNFLYQFLILFLPFITAPYLSRVINADGIGTYSYSYSIATYFIYFAMLGLNNYGNRTIAATPRNRKELSRKFSEIYEMQFITSAICISLYLFYAFFVAKDGIVAIIQGIYVFSALFDINWFFFGIEQFKLTVIRNTIIKSLTVALVFIFVKGKDDIYIYTFIMASGFLASQLYLWAFLNKFVSFKPMNIKAVLAHLKPNSVLFIPVIAVSIYRIMGKVMLGNMRTMTDVGYFESAEKIINVPIALIIAVGTVMLPRMSVLISENKLDESKRYIDNTMLIVLAFVNAAAFGILSVSSDFVYIFYGKGFSDTAVIMNYLAVTIIFMGFGNVIRTQHLIPYKKDKVYIVSAILAAIANVVFNLILIPILGAIGAAIGTVIAEVVVCSYQVYCVRNDINLKDYLRYEIIFLSMAVVMYVAIQMMPSLSSSTMTLIMQIIFGSFIYVALIYIFVFRKLFKRADT